MRKAAITRAGALAAALAALTGCGKPADQPASSATPTRKPGLWEQALIRDGKPGKLGVIRVCLDAAADARLGVFGRHFGKGDCRRSSTRDAAGVYHFSSTCTVSSGAVITTRGVASGDFKSNFEAHSEVAVTGAPFQPMNGAHAVTITGHYKGACPAGMRPGDVSLGSGMKISIDQLSRIAGAMEGGGA